MQPSASLPHTRSRPVHWVVTAAAVAGTVLGAALAGPAEDHAEPVATAKAPAAPAPLPAPDPAAARYPLECGPAGVEVTGTAAADLDRDGRPETAVAVRCHSGAGTPPSGVYVLGAPQAPGGSPRVLATLVDPRQRMSVTGLQAAAGTVSATLLGYSSAGVPRCCPDLRRAVKWHWRGGKFVLGALPVSEAA
ncbi:MULTISPECIES: hypothetical protein [Streptomyces]|uniref:Secreted protein n=1 Tax=Streptomyces luteosporeus TaxID=173856 RepID=A0ABN3TM79_9ACTN